MFGLHPYIFALLPMTAVAVALWLYSLPRRDVSIVDSMWPLFFVIAAGAYAYALPDVGPRLTLVFALLIAWALRLSGYITWRNWGEGEDRRYQQIRSRNEPFALKSLYIVFLLQAALAWVVSLPLFAALAGSQPLNWIDAAGALICVVGIGFESIGDFQLARFKGDPDNEGKVMDRGLWRYTRHPNYFGDFCVWWGFWLIAVAAGGWWSVFGPLLMSVLLLRVSGVALLEKDMSERRPKYRDYVKRTNAFFPGPTRAADGGEPA